MIDSDYSQLIFPFGFILSQKAATEKALAEQISVIEGPPGTGKTQTILNIIANAMMNNKTVAVVSNNNSATANVLEKLEKYGVDFFAAFLGNKENKEKFFNEQKGVYPDMSSWIIPPQAINTMKTILRDSQQKLNDMLGIQNRLSDLKQKFTELQTEYKYFNQYFQESGIGSMQLSSLYRIRSDNLLKLLFQFKKCLEKESVSFRTKLYNLFTYGIYSFRFYYYTPEAIVSFLQKSYYEKKMKELQNDIEALTHKLGNYHFDREMKEYSAVSMKLLKAELVQQYKKGKNRVIFSTKDLWKNFDSFIKEYPVILSTTHSLRSCTSENYLFDYVIIDEASQVDVVTGALALSCAKKAVIVGDYFVIFSLLATGNKKKLQILFGILKCSA